jgi:uncharacterized cupredoxin-like copper-binding protein
MAMTPAFAAKSTTVNVSLWDRGSNAMDMLGQGRPMGMAMMGNMTVMDMPMNMMGITADLAEVPAGEVTFKVTNDSTGDIHEMVVAPIKDPKTPLPYLADEQRVDEEAAGHLGEVSELDPGQHGALTLTMKPGTYILYCNIPGHYVLGMWTLITVTK